MLAHCNASMSSAPPPPPAETDSAVAWQAWRQDIRRRDRAALAARRGSHPQVFREPGLASANDWEALSRSVSHAGILKQGKSSRVVRLHATDGTPVILKHYLPTRRLDPRDRLGFSKAMRSLLAAEALDRRGFLVARPLACWSRAGAGSWLLLEDLADSLPLHQAAAETCGADRRELLTAVARTVRRLHRSGVAYRDLKPSNLMVRLQPLELRFVDHDRNRFSSREIPRRVALRDLAALHAGLPPEIRATERLRALQCYDPSLLDAEQWNRFLPAVLEEAAQRRHRWIPRRLLGGTCSVDSASLP